MGHGLETSAHCSRHGLLSPVLDTPVQGTLSFWSWIPPAPPSCTLPRAPGPGDTAQPLVPLPCKPLQLPQVSQDAQVTKSGYESHLPARSSPQPNQPAGGRGTKALLRAPCSAHFLLSQCHG